MRMTRFWITLEQGVELVFKALQESKGGETYISKIPSFHIGDLAKAMLPDCEIDELEFNGKFTGSIKLVKKMH